MIILKETKKTKLSPRKRRGWTQVADGRSSQANAATSRWLCDRHSTGKTTRSHIRQRFDCKRNPAARDESWAVVLVRRGCHLLVDWWSCVPGNRRRRKGGKRMLVERRRCPRLSLPKKNNTQITVMLSDLWSITVTFNVALSQRHAHTHTHFHEDTSHTAPSCLTTQYWTCDGVKVRAGMRTRVAQAGRHHQQSTDDDDGGVSFHSAALM